jgi:hypothetical protein
MIEYKAHFPWGVEEAGWREYGKNWKTPSKNNISVFMFRIDDVIYEKYSKEFVKAFNTARIWERLKQ